ncbi:MAG: hypothetical protein WD080_11755 [Egibacteraceae bacterium]
MTRLGVAAAHEIRLQWRYGILAAAVFVTAVWVGVLRALPAAVMPTAIPVVVFADSAVIGLFFLAGAVLFEKDEGTQAALVVTPLRDWEYLTAKLAPLAVLSIAVALVITTAAAGGSAAPGLIAVGVGLLSLAVLLVAYATAVRFDSITDYIVGVQAPLLPLALPLVPYLVEAVAHPAWWLAPTNGAMVLIDGAVNGIGGRLVAVAILVQAAWVLALVPPAARAHRRYVRGER